MGLLTYRSIVTATSAAVETAGGTAVHAGDSTVTAHEDEQLLARRYRKDRANPAPIPCESKDTARLTAIAAA
jgi:hypothetical protein